MGPGVPIPAKSNSWVVSVAAWCWILVDSGRYLAKIARGLGFKAPKSTNKDTQGILQARNFLLVGARTLLGALPLEYIHVLSECLWEHL